MATPGVITQLQSFLPAELWHLVFSWANAMYGFDYTHDGYFLDPPPKSNYYMWMRKTCLVSKEFAELVTAHAWESINLCNRREIREYLTYSRCPRAIQNMRHHTKYVSIDGSMNRNRQDIATQLFTDCNRLEYFSWSFIPQYSDFRIDDRKMAIISLNAARCFSEFMDSPVALNSFEFIFETLSHDIVMRRKTGVSNKKDRTELPLAPGTSQVLNKVHLRSHRNKIISWNLDRPTTRKLKLEAFSWPSVQSVLSTWNFNNLQCLSIKNSDLEQFLEGVPMPYLSQLRAFKFRQHKENYRTHKLCQKPLERLLKSCQHLNSLKIECPNYSDLIPWQTIRSVGPGLEVLRLLDISNHESYPGLFELKELLQDCPSIKDLGIGFIVHTQLNDEFDEYLGQLIDTAKNLRSLTIWEKDLCHPDLPFADWRSTYVDPNYKRALSIMEHLHGITDHDSKFQVKIHIQDGFNTRKINDKSRYDDRPGWRTFKSRVNSEGKIEQWGSVGDESLEDGVGGELDFDTD